MRRLCEPATATSREEDKAYSTVFHYFYDLFKADFDSAFAQLDPANHPATLQAQFLENVKTSRDRSDGEAMRLFDLVAVKQRLGHAAQRHGGQLQGRRGRNEFFAKLSADESGIDRQIVLDSIGENL